MVNTVEPSSSSLSSSVVVVALAWSALRHCCKTEVSSSSEGRGVVAMVDGACGVCCGYGGRCIRGRRRRELWWSRKLCPNLLSLSSLLIPLIKKQITERRKYICFHWTDSFYPVITREDRRRISRELSELRISTFLQCCFPSSQKKEESERRCSHSS